MLADRVALFDYALKTNVETWRRMGVAMTGPTQTDDAPAPGRMPVTST